MRTWEGIDLAAIKDPAIRDALFIVNRYLSQISPAAGSNTEQGDVSIPTVKELDTFVLADKAVPIAGVTAVPGQVRVVRVDSAGQLLVSALLSGAVDTELPAAVPLSDALANPTAPLVGASLLLWESAGSAWHRGRGDTNGEIYRSRKPAKQALTALEGDYVTATPTKTITAIDVSRYTRGSIGCLITVTAAPTSMTFEIWFSNDGGANFIKKSDTYWANNILDRTSLAAQGSRLWQFDLSGVDELEIRFISAGTGAATPKFTVANADLGLWQD